ncbi:CotO family spore coat protein [Heyndrickxia sp. NPDC080065]|uniref:CotO family spore coat protein n=1 Tax=Heyndrickxia sp. NPDC080065 TaxID=3390568 RepID=UPI003D03346B
MGSSQNQFNTSKPLLYIIEPKSQEIFVNMQRTYMTKLSKEEFPEKSIAVDNNDMSEINITDKEMAENERPAVQEYKEVEEEPIQIQIENYIENEAITEETIAVEESLPINTGYRRRSFKDMDIDEKIYFLVNMPRYLPKVIVEIKTETISYSGIVLKYENGMILFDQLLLEEKPLQIDVKEINDIKFVSK